MKWAYDYARAESNSWKDDSCLEPKHRPTATFGEFKLEVHKDYPELDNDCDHTNCDLEYLVEQTRDHQDTSDINLGDHYQQFITYRACSMKQGHLSEYERSAHCLRGFLDVL